VIGPEITELFHNNAEELMKLYGAKEALSKLLALVYGW